MVSPEWLNQCRTLKRKLAESGFSAYPTEITTSGRKSNIGTKQGQDTRPRRGPFLMDSEDEGEEMKEATSDIFKPLVSAQCETVDVTFTTFSEGSILRDHKENISPRAQSVESTTESISITTKAVTTTAVTELLKLGKEKLSSALDKRKKPRARLQGRATSNMSSLEANFSRASSATSSTEDQSGGATSAEKHNNSNGALIQDPDSVPPDPTQYPMSQAVSYADPEAQRERRRMIAKLNGVEAVETPRAVKTREVIQDTVTPRRTTRSHH